MSTHNEVQPSNSLPNLSTWHRVPIGETIPKGTPYAYAYENCVTAKLRGHFEDIPVRDRDNSHCTYYYTERPISPPLPTEEGATILVSSGNWPQSTLLTREEDRWVTRYGAEWSVDQIRTWAPVTIGETVVMP